VHSLSTHCLYIRFLTSPTFILIDTLECRRVDISHAGVPGRSQRAGLHSSRPRRRIVVVRYDGCSLKSLQMVLQQQSMVLHQIAEKLEVTVEQSGGLGLPSSQHRVSVVPSDGGFHAAGPDSLQVGRAGSTIVERPRRRSVRITVDKSERPPSTVL